MELGKTCFFENTKAGFHSFLDWIYQLVKACKLNQGIVGMESTGHYWLNLAHLLKGNNIKFVSFCPKTICT
nr:transposase [Peribacillus simplex]